MTTAQEEVLDKVNDLLREHFDGSVVLTLTHLDEDGRTADETCVYYNGGKTLAIGLCEFGKNNLLNNKEEE